MSRFYIKDIAASGDKVEYSSVSFTSGINIMHGPSNSGKSYVINCINFMMGAKEAPFTRASTRYDTVHMSMESVDGNIVKMKRKIVDGTKTDVGANIVEVVSNMSDIKSGEYSISKLEYSQFLLKLMGIEEGHKIISTQEFKIQNLTIRTFFHSFFIDEDFIYEKTPAFDVPAHSKITACLTALHFLFCGEDLQEIVPAESKKERELREAKKKAVIIYINDKIQYLTERRSSLEQNLAEVDTDVEAKIESTLEEIATVENQIQEATENSRKYMEEIYKVSAKLEEATYLRDRYKILKTQYSSDMKRLRFIIDGETKGDEHPQVVKCPFCESSMTNKPQQRVSYTEASKIELERVGLQLQDLQEADKDLAKEINLRQEQLRVLNEQNNQLTQQISRGLKPKAIHLQDLIDSYKRIVQIKNELSAVDAMSVDLNTDAFNQEQQGDNDTPKFKAMAHMDMKRWKQWSDTFEEIVKECNYPNCTSARISPDTYDAVINGKHKSDEGKGYRAFINSIILFSLMKTLEDRCSYRPALLVLDSPILTLKEKVRDDELAEPGMRDSLFKYFIEHCGDNQIIIAENEIPKNPAIDYSAARLIEFTQDENKGVYGFLKSVRNSKNS